MSSCFILFSIFERTCAYAWWAHMHHFLSVRLSVCYLTKIQTDSQTCQVSRFRRDCPDFGLTNPLSRSKGQCPDRGQSQLHFPSHTLPLTIYGSSRECTPPRVSVPIRSDPKLTCLCFTGCFLQCLQAQSTHFDTLTTPQVTGSSYLNIGPILMQ